MGLDLVELVIEVEETFRITIPNEEAANIVTVGQLYECIFSKQMTRETNRCLSAAAFFQFRRALTDQFGINRGNVRPSTIIGRIVPGQKRRSEWQHLARKLDWRLPPLVRPAWMSFALCGLLLSWAVTIVAAWGWTNGFSPGAVFLVVASILFSTILFAVVAMMATTPFATLFPREWQTVRGTVQAALTLNYAKISTQVPGWNRQEIWECLRAIIVEQLGVSTQDVTSSAEFVKDFGAD
jgi:acyl carrier protein